LIVRAMAAIFELAFFLALGWYC